MKKNSAEVDRAKLREAGLRLTRHTKALLAYLAKIKSPISAQDLHRQTKDQKWDLATVYRLLFRLEKAGLVRTTMFRARARWFEQNTGKVHHHHMFCTRCGRIQKLEYCAVKSLSAKARSLHGFRVSSHTMELFGLCQRCSRLNNTAHRN